MPEKQNAENIRAICTAYTCAERGTRARCFLDIYKFCAKYEHFILKPGQVEHGLTEKTLKQAREAGL